MLGVVVAGRACVPSRAQRVPLPSLSNHVRTKLCAIQQPVCPLLAMPRRMAVLEAEDAKKWEGYSERVRRFDASIHHPPQL
jgi:hypothetical protein